MKPLVHLLVAAIAACVAILLGPTSAVAQMGALLFKPGHSFSQQPAPAAPDYAAAGSWAALPDTHQTAAVDTFFVHPTTFLSREAWNAPFDRPGGGVGGGGVEATLNNQASAFGECCRLFAPRYRQATLYSFLDSGADGPQALELAYQDVRRAFDEYLAHRNGGRPFILAGHSQGSLHVVRLIHERISGTPLLARLVAAYAVGAGVPRSFSAIPICATALQAGCLVSWNAVSDAASDHSHGGTLRVWMDGGYQSIGARPLLCVNPLDWRIDGSAPASANLGALTGADTGSGPKQLKPGFASAACMSGQLVVDLPPGGIGRRSWFNANGSLHIYDYNLFYENIRVNAKARIAAYFANRN